METDSTWMQVCSWIPPLSIFAAPLSYAAGDFTALQLGLSFLIALAATIAVVWLAARIYRRSILNNGRVTKWSEALKGSPALRDSWSFLRRCSKSLHYNAYPHTPAERTSHHAPRRRPPDCPIRQNRSA